MILPEGDHASKQIRASQYRTIMNSCSAYDDMAATSSCLAIAAETVLLTDQSILASFVVEQDIDLLQLIPTSGGGQVYFENPGVRSDTE